MIPSAFVFNGVNIVIGVASLLLIVLASKAIKEKGARTLVRIALVLLILSAIILPVCLHVYKFGPAAYVGQVAGVPSAKGAYDRVKNFRYFALVGTLCETASVVLLVVASRRLVVLPAAEPAGEEG